DADAGVARTRRNHQPAARPPHPDCCAIRPLPQRERWCLRLELGSPLPRGRGRRVAPGEGAYPRMTTTRYISRLRLSHFRNSASAARDLDSRHLVLVGPNGAGKTNLLEAISLLAPDRGLRRAPFETLAAQGSDGAWAVAATVETADGPADIGTGAGAGESGRRVRINGASARTVEEMSAWLRLLWLTPA